MPAMPQKAAGSRTLPAASLPRPERRSARRDQRRFPAAAAAGSARGVIGVIGGAENEVVAFEGEEQIGQIGFGDRDRTGAAQPADERGIFAARARRCLAAQRPRCADAACEFDRILDGEWNAVQRARRFTSSDGRIGGARLCDRLIFEDLDRRVESGVDQADLFQMSLQ